MSYSTTQSPVCAAHRSLTGAVPRGRRCISLCFLWCMWHQFRRMDYPSAESAMVRSLHRLGQPGSCALCRTGGEETPCFQAMRSAAAPRTRGSAACGTCSKWLCLFASCIHTRLSYGSTRMAKSQYTPLGRRTYYNTCLPAHAAKDAVLFRRAFGRAGRVPHYARAGQGEVRVTPVCGC